VNVRLTIAVGFAVAAFGLTAAASATPPVALGPAATAEGLAIQVVGPDGGTISSTSAAAAPPAATLPGAPFAYPEDASVVSAESTTVQVSASAPDGTASAVTEIDHLSLFAGEITLDSARGSVSSAGTVGDLSDSTLTNLVVAGAPVGVAPNARVPVADWGYALLLPQSTKTGTTAKPSWRGTVSALVVHLDVDHAGLPAGSEIRIGYADAYARPPEAAAPTPTTTATTTAATTSKHPSPKAPANASMPAPSLAGAPGVTSAKKKARKKSGLPVFLSPPTVTPKLTAGGYVFPV